MGHECGPKADGKQQNRPGPQAATGLLEDPNEAETPIRV